MKIKISKPWPTGTDTAHFTGFLSACGFNITPSDLLKRTEPIIVETEDLTMLSHMRNYGANAEAVKETKSKTTFDIKIMSPWPAHLKGFYEFVKEFGHKQVPLTKTPELLLKEANWYTIEQLKKFGVGYEVLENDKTSMAEPLIEEHISEYKPVEVVSDNHLDVIIHPPYPAEKSPRGAEFWAIFDQYSVGASKTEDGKAIIIKNMTRKHYEAIGVLDVQIAKYPMPIEESPEQVNVIIQYPFPTDITAQGKRFWDLMEKYSPYIKNREAPQMPIVIFNMMYTHYEELRKTSALISEYSPVEDGCVVPEPAKTEKVYNLILSSPWPEGSRVWSFLATLEKAGRDISNQDLQKLECISLTEVSLGIKKEFVRILGEGKVHVQSEVWVPKTPEPVEEGPILPKEFRFGFTVGKLKIEAITKNPSASMEQMVYDTLLAIGCSSSQAAEYVKFAYTPREEFFEKGLKLDINFNEFPDIFATEAEFKIKL